VDIFLWLSQRRDKIKSIGLSDKLLDVTEPFYISRISSEMITRGWIYKLSNYDLTEEQIEEGEKTIEKMENIHLERLREFEEKQAPKDNKTKC